MKKLKIKFPSFKLGKLGRKKERVREKQPGNKKIPILAGSLVLMLVVLLLSAWHLYRQEKFSVERLSYVAEQKLLSQQIATNAFEAASGNDAAFGKLQGFRERYQQTVDLITNGNPATGLPAAEGELAKNLEEMNSLWIDYRDNIDAIVSDREIVRDISQQVDAIKRVLPVLATLSEEISVIASKTMTSSQTLLLSGRQALFLERVENNLGKILSGGEDAVTAADQFQTDFDQFARAVGVLLRGNMDIPPIKSVDAQDKLSEELVLYEQVRENIDNILGSSSSLFEVKDSSTVIQLISPELLLTGNQIEETVNATDEQNAIVYVVGGIAGTMMVVLILLGSALLLKDARKRAEESVRINRMNQEAILQLLDEMTHLADGDLSAHTTVTESITGAIADSVNFSIDALRSLVETINSTVVQVSSSSQKTKSIATRLEQASGEQAQEIASTTQAISTMASTMEKMSDSAMQSADVALRSVEMANNGAQTVRRNIDAMDSIRDTIQETSKRIKRLGESSQQIGEIIALITDIADRTNILALNAAIQASSAGEAGRGFAVVADEVQRLAERAGDATKQISALVETIQTDTNEAVSSMEQSTAGVVNGAKLAEDAGSALVEIENVSQQLASLIQGISKDAKEQASTAVHISESMNSIQRITEETSESTRETATSVGNLTELANELKKSVAGFKLPDMDLGETYNSTYTG